MIHPIQWPDIIIGLLIAEGILYSVRSVLHYISNRRRNMEIVERVEQMRPGSLDAYRAVQERGVRAPLG